MTDWLKMERAEAKRDGARPHKNSGRGTEKGDASLEGVTVDYKHSAKSFTLTKQVWGKVCMDALKNKNAIPMIKVVIGEENETKTRLWVIDEGMFKEMYQAWLTEYGEPNEV